MPSRAEEVGPLCANTRTRDPCDARVMLYDAGNGRFIAVNKRCFMMNMTFLGVSSSRVVIKRNQA